MKQFLLLTFSIIFCSLTAFSQKSLNDYAYILVPQQFEFQRSKDQHRLNTLIRHLFNQSGFKALYEEELGSLPRCEGVYANVIEEKAFLSTKFVITISDCFNNELYRSQVGQSKEKDHSISYPEAIRSAFKSIMALNIKQKDISEISTETAEQTKISQTIETEVTLVKNNDLEKYARYLFNENNYYLEQKNENFILYFNDKNTNTLKKAGELNVSSRAGMYVFTANGTSNLANFDENKNLIIDGKDANGNAVQNVYKLIEE